MSHSIEILDLIEHGNVEQIRMYLSQYPQYNLQATNQLGQNLLHIVIEKSKKNMFEIIQIFLNKGLDPMAIDANFTTALDLAIEKKLLGIVSIFKIKIEEKKKQDLQLLEEFIP